MVNIKKFYLDTYKDLFFVNTPPFFEFFMWTEVFFQAPVMAWGIVALHRSEYPELLERDIKTYFLSQICYFGCPIRRSQALVTHAVIFNLRNGPETPEPSCLEMPLFSHSEGTAGILDANLSIA